MIKTFFIVFILAVLIIPNQAYAKEKLAWNGREIGGWVCNGKELKPKFGANGNNTWIFDGREIKPKFDANGSNTWGSVT